MNCAKKGSTHILSLQTEHTFEDTLIGSVNLCELFDVKPKNEKQIKELKKINIDKQQKDTLLETIQNILETQFNDTSSEYKPDYPPDETSFYFKTCGERTCPRGFTHTKNNFVVKYNQDSKLLCNIFFQNVHVIIIQVKKSDHLVQS